MIILTIKGENIHQPGTEIEECVSKEGKTSASNTNKVVTGAVVADATMKDRKEAPNDRKSLHNKSRPSRINSKIAQKRSYGRLSRVSIQSIPAVEAGEALK